MKRIAFFTVIWVILNLFACHQREVGCLDEIDSSWLVVGDVELRLRGLGEEMHIQMAYRGDKTIYFASGTQFFLDNGTLYYGINDFAQYLEKQRVHYRRGQPLFWSDYGLIELTPENTNEGFQRVMFRTALGQRHYRDVLSFYEEVQAIEKIVLTFYYYTECEIHALQDINERGVRLYDYDQANEEYLRILESGKGRKIELAITDFEIILELVDLIDEYKLRMEGNNV